MSFIKRVETIPQNFDTFMESILNSREFMRIITWIYPVFSIERVIELTEILQI